MSAKKTVISLAILLAMLFQPVVAPAQGFAGLGSNAEGFEIPRRDYKLVFPRDHGAHPGFRIEWWYVTADLVAADGRRMGAQWTLFRSALAPPGTPGAAAGWSDPQIWIGHAAVTTETRHYVAERLARGGVGQANVVAEPFEAWIDNWQMTAKGAPQLDHVALSASGDSFSYQLSLDAQAPLVLQGDQGYSVKSASGQASHYYSQPFYRVSGTVVLDGEAVTVEGKAWLDREWSSQPLASDQSGWDWFSLHLNSGEKVMAFRLRDTAGGFISANWISADGTTEVLDKTAVSLEPVGSATVEGREVPVAWRIRIPGKGLDITTTALNDQSWMKTTTPYWEGPVSFSGSTAGVGYLEMTGY